MKLRYMDVYRRLGQLHEQEVKELKSKVSELSSAPVVSQTLDGAVPYSQSSDFTESTCTSRAGSKVRFIRPPEITPPEFATHLPDSPEHDDNNDSPSAGVTQSRTRDKEKASSFYLPSDAMRRAGWVETIGFNGEFSNKNGGC
eukprot:s1355_g11.t1